MAYRKLGRTCKHRRAMLANLTKDLIKNERIETTETRAKEVRKFFDKMVTYGKNGSLVARRNALAFLHNDNEAVKKVFDELEFSVRAYNCLKRANINTLQDLTQKSENEMMKIRNLGKKSLKEVIDKVKEMGFSFRNED